MYSEYDRGRVQRGNNDIMRILAGRMRVHFIILRHTHARTHTQNQESAEVHERVELRVELRESDIAVAVSS